MDEVSYFAEVLRVVAFDILLTTIPLKNEEGLSYFVNPSLNDFK